MSLTRHLCGPPVQSYFIFLLCSHTVPLTTSGQGGRRPCRVLISRNSVIRRLCVCAQQNTDRHGAENLQMATGQRLPAGRMLQIFEDAAAPLGALPESHAEAANRKRRTLNEEHQRQQRWDGHSS